MSGVFEYLGDKMPPDIFILILSFVLGMVIGSFLNVCIYRIPAKISVVWPASHCFNCNNKIKWYDNIPVLSFLVLGGKCRKCKSKISFQYPLVEFITGCLTVLFVWKTGINWWLPFVLITLFSTIVLSVIDIKTMEIPNRFSLGLILVGLAGSFFNPAFDGTLWERFLSSLIGGAVGFFGLWITAIIGSAIFKKEAMGGGDIKLMGAIGALTGWIGVVNSLVIASFAGIIYFGILLMLKKNIENNAIPFGPFLSAGLLFCMLMPNFTIY